MTWIKISIPLLLAVCVISCDFKYADPQPDYGLYKTLDDYFEYYFPQTNQNGDIVANPYYEDSDPRILFTEDDTILACRVRLNGGYVLSAEVDPYAPVTDVTYKEIIKKRDTEEWINSLILDNRIIDRNPFNEYYNVPASFVTESDFTAEYGYEPASYGRYQAFLEAAERANKIIEEGRLEEEFDRVK